VKPEASLRFGSPCFSREKLRDDAIWLQVWFCLSLEWQNQDCFGKARLAEAVCNFPSPEHGRGRVRVKAIVR